MQQGYVQKFVQHPENAIVEYPETGHSTNEAIAHIFPVSTEESGAFDPKMNIQYGIWGKHGSRDNTRLFLMPQNTKGFTLCKKFKARCMGVKQCTYHGFPRHFSPVSESSELHSNPSFVDSAQHEVFMKTLGFFCVLMQNGCPFDPEYEWELENEFDSQDISDSEHPLLFYERLRDTRCYTASSNLPKCKGKPIFRKNDFDQSFIQCENRRKGHKAHLIIRNLNEFNLEYLQALFSNNLSLILTIEKEARKLGYGPLLPCDFVSATRDQKELCPHFHRYEDGILKRGILEHSDQCTARFEVYYSNEAALNPWIVMVCQHPHTHPDPRPTRTPQIIEDSFLSLLETLGWRLADATPRRIILDAAFMTGLRNILGWQGVLDPSLSDLHPSLGNFDHTARLINKLRSEHFPHGTGFKEQVYVQCAETYESPSERKFTIIICMFKAMSVLLLQAKRPSMDTSFKRIHGWQEFESEAWFAEYARSVVVCRAFTSSQSAEAHRILFQRIFEIVEADTGQQVQFRHIHGSGWDTVIGDEHRGQALADPLPNFDGTLAIIRQGEKKAQDWFKDKLAAGGCMLAAVYHPASQIPVDVWKASPNTTNGNRVFHGAMRGFQYDPRAMVTLKVLEEHGIHPRDRLPTYYRRASRAVVRTVAVQRRTVKAHDAALEKAYNQNSQLVDKAASQAKSLKRTQAFGKAAETALKRLPGRFSAQHHIYSTFPNVASGSQPYIHSDHAADGTIPSSMQYTFKVDLPQVPTAAKHPGPAHPANQTALPGLHILPTQQQTVNPNMLPLLQSPVDRPFPPAAYGHPFQMHYGSRSQPLPGCIGQTDNVPSTSPSSGKTPYPHTSPRPSQYPYSNSYPSSYPYPYPYPHPYPYPYPYQYPPHSSSE
ncbi:hypothetical protein M422DRAFT_253914 [Sphaerobolus stellatus SS14]|uniref:Uncharacterized protein n=1 Tax=Sphaerobolus stellatus (strain SS14) TaxID=990650 RepID=A0A0C9V760_SPHS4|nr:hypothetical protein M422DRAFT_253914 [Sphaerobolus stellatus SS14]